MGDMLWLDRTLSVVGAAAGHADAGISGGGRDVRSRPRRGAGVGCLGVLSHMRPRRAKVLQKGDRLRMGDVEAMCHWAGLTTTGTGLLPQAVYPSPGFVWAANESGLGALRRYLSDQAVVLRSAGADSEQDHTRVELLPLPGSIDLHLRVAEWPGRRVRHARDRRLGADA